MTGACVDGIKEKLEWHVYDCELSDERSGFYSRASTDARTERIFPFEEYETMTIRVWSETLKWMKFGKCGTCKMSFVKDQLRHWSSLLGR